jgi:hypothetical protein
MKRWAFVTVLLYAVALIVLAAPVILLTCGNWWGFERDNGGDSGIAASDVLQLFKAWQFWLWLGVMVLGQILLLLVPVDVSQRRLVPRRKLLVPIITAAFLLANIVFAGIFSAACAIFGDGAFKAFEIFGDGNTAPWVVLILIIVLLWTIWGFVFYRMTKKNEPQDITARLTRVLLKGSILELLVAIPSHVIVRNRDVCCAPIVSFWGIATGISVMLLCFGPGVYFLFVERFQKLKPKPADKEINS